MGCISLNESFDQGLAHCREQKRAMIERSRERRAQMEQTYADRLVSFKKGEWRMAYKTVRGGDE